MIRFEDLLEKVKAYSPAADVELLRRAYVFSAFEHRNQVRHSGEPYLIHPLAVADFPQAAPTNASTTNPSRSPRRVRSRCIS